MAWGNIVGRRLVLPPETTEAMITSFIGLLKAQKVLDQRTCPVGGINREVVWCPSPDYYVHYSTTTTFGLAVMWISGATVEVVEKFTNFLVEYFELPSDDALISAIDQAQTPEEFGPALIMAGLGAPSSADARFFDRITSAVKSSDAQIREAGMWGALHTQWPECQPLIQHIATTDPSDELRRAAQAAIAHAGSEAAPHEV